MYKGYKQVVSVQEFRDCYSQEPFLKNLGEQQSSKCGPETSSISLTWKLVGNASSGALTK